MGKEQLIYLYGTLPDLSGNLQEKLGTGKVGPVIGEGNCAFRSIFQSLLLNACSSREKKELLITYLRTLYLTNKENVEVEHGQNRIERNISFDDFEQFIREFISAKVSDGTFEKFFKAYFPHQRDGDDTFLIPANDKVVKFMACCLRKDVVSHQLANGTTQHNQGVLEDRFFNINEGSIEYFKEKGIDLILYEDIGLDDMKVLHTGEYNNKPLIAEIAFDIGQPNQHGDFDNGHYYVIFTESMLLDLLHLDDSVADDLYQNIQEEEEIIPAQPAPVVVQRPAIEDANDDHVVALQLQQLEHANYAAALQLDQEEDANYAAALQLQQEEDANYAAVLQLQQLEDANYAAALQLQQEEIIPAQPAPVVVQRPATGLVAGLPLQGKQNSTVSRWTPSFNTFVRAGLSLAAIAIGVAYAKSHISRNSLS